MIRRLSILALQPKSLIMMAHADRAQLAGEVQCAGKWIALPYSVQTMYSWHNYWAAPCVGHLVAVV
jgi:hypothetical protein